MKLHTLKKQTYYTAFFQAFRPSLRAVKFNYALLMPPVVLFIIPLLQRDYKWLRTVQPY